jgi:inorganic pyrophosphatase
MSKRRAGSMADPTKLKLRKKKSDEDVLQVIVETPKGSHNKFAFDPKQRIFTLRRCCPPA